MSNRQFTFCAMDRDGKEIECVALNFKFNEQTGKNYIVYTDNSVDPADGCTKVFASIFNPDADDMVLHPIETEEEWDFVHSMLSELETESDQENQ
ncbi:MAG: DUF1292 domain-containing protein [Clostridia bacterium]|nr:DUF1292 domain-containing protein [Clostridia bacterium]